MPCNYLLTTDKAHTYISYCSIETSCDPTTFSRLVGECDLDPVDSQGWTTGIIASTEVRVELLEGLTYQLISLSYNLKNLEDSFSINLFCIFILTDILNTGFFSLPEQSQISRSIF